MPRRSSTSSTAVLRLWTSIGTSALPVPGWSSVPLGGVCTRPPERGRRAAGASAVRPDQEQRLARDLLGQEQHHLGALVGDIDGKRDIIARRPSLHGNGRERAHVARRRGPGGRRRRKRRAI